MAQRLKTVFILGAGASRQAGAPLVGDFIDKARDLHRTGAVGNRAADFRVFFDALADAQVIHSKSRLDTNNIEAVFSTFEFAQIVKAFCGYEERQISALPGAARGVITQTIEEMLQFPVTDGSPGPPEPYDAFARLVAALRQKPGLAHDVAIVTFNYDYAVDFAFRGWRDGVDYGFERPFPGALPLLKLHGSLHWAGCSQCGAVIPALMQDRGYAADIASVKLAFSERLATLGHCDVAVRPDPVIVPPTSNKVDYHVRLSTVWSAAARELAGADNIFVIGYSLPETDVFFRYLYALGTVGRQVLERFWIFDPDSTGTVKARFLSMLGPAVERRFVHERVTFAEAIPMLGQAFGV
ncbi:MAG: hypothetical protein ACJ74H_02100 [Thermoanaerobaculia bacterium]